MARDFTMIKYRELLTSSSEAGYALISFEEFIGKQCPERCIVLRHDVDAQPVQSLLKAEIEKEMGARSTYYFRIVDESNDPGIIRKIAALGHEIGYHYEDLSLANGNYKKAIRLFEKNLEYFRTYYPVKTICMHGSPASPWDNRLIWRDHRYQDYGILGEPYFDTDFSSTLYLTDTGRKWDGTKVSVRDKVKHPFQQQFHLRSTDDIVRALNAQSLPARIMLTTHPQRWHDDWGPWCRELVLQGIKNRIKKHFYVANPMTE